MLPRREASTERESCFRARKPISARASGEGRLDASSSPLRGVDGACCPVHRARVPAPCAHQPAELLGARTVPARLPPGGAAAPPLHARCDTATSRACCRPFRRRHPCCTHVATPQLVACLLPPVPAAVPRAARTLRRRNFSCSLPLAPAAAFCAHTLRCRNLWSCAHARRPSRRRDQYTHRARVARACTPVALRSCSCRVCARARVVPRSYPCSCACPEVQRAS